MAITVQSILDEVAGDIQDVNKVRATNARLTATGWRKVREAAPGHVDNVQRNVIDALSAEQVHQLTGIAEAILGRLDPEQAMSATYHRYDVP